MFIICSMIEAAYTEWHKKKFYIKYEEYERLQQH